MWQKLAASVLTKLAIYIIEWLAFALPSALIKWKDKKRREKEQQAALDKFENLPKDSSYEEKGKAYEDVVNSGR